MLNPSSALALGMLAQLHGNRGDIAAARSFADRALRLSPFADQRGAHTGLMFASFFAGEYSATVEASDAVLQTSASWTVGWRYRAAALALLGRDAEAREAGAQLARISPEFSVTKFRAHLAPYPDRNDHRNFFAAEAIDAFCEGLRRAGVPE